VTGRRATRSELPDAVDASDHAPSWSRVEGTLMATARSVRRAYDAALAEVDLNLSEASILAYLARGGSLSQVELARRIGTGRARAGVHIDRLEAKGAVVREADPDDRRIWRISLTPAGRELWARSVDVDAAVRRRLRVNTTEDQRDVLDAVLTTIRRNAEGSFEAR
jgi:DNA-binding MarR family transcriptional regulator